MAGDCEGEVALVTGASRGIGLAIAERLAAEGAKVALTARTLRPEDSAVPGSLEEGVERIRLQGGEAASFTADLADPGADLAGLVDRVEDELGSVSILVNNAAANFYHPLSEMTDKRLQIALSVNVRAPLELARCVLPGMRERGRGWILNISSATAQMPSGHPREGTTGPLLYVATKAALERATCALAEELYSQDIAVNSLAPQAGVRTAAVDQYYDLDESVLEPAETMAAAALHLCSGEPRERTGWVTRSLKLLVDESVPVYDLGGVNLLEGWQPDEIDRSRLENSGSSDESALRS